MTKQIYPEQLDERVVTSLAEKTLYKAFRDQLPDAFAVFHSISWLGRRRGRKRPADGEADFVLCHPQLGVLVLEVKGGLIGCNEGGQWYSVRRDNDVAINIKDPLAQARANKYALIGKMKELPNWPGPLPTVEHAVAFPDGVTELKSVSLAGPAEIIMQHGDLADVAGWLRHCMLFWQGEDGFVAPGAAGVEVLKELLARSWQLRPPRLGEQIGVESDRISRYTEEQFELLGQLDRVPRAAIRGCAGSGKTMLAIHKAKKLAREGFNVLLTCYNRRLADQLRRVTSNRPRLTVYDFHELCRLYAAKTGYDQRSDWDERGDDFFDRVMPEALLEAAVTGHGSFRFDAILIDEGQDFQSEWLSALELLLTDPKQGIFYIFYDDNQLLYDRRLQLPVQTVARALTTNCRNTKAIHRAVMAYYKSDLFLRSRGPDGRKAELLSWPEEPAEQVAVLASVLARLVYEENVQIKDIVILGPRGLDGPPFSDMPTMQSFRLVADAAQSDKEIQCTSVRMFKGLESPVIILVMPADTWRLSEMMYVGLSRAQNHIVVLAAGNIIGTLLQVELLVD